jgi:RND family efflux transporter MFP subunit
MASLIRSHTRSVSHSAGKISATVAVLFLSVSFALHGCGHASAQPQMAQATEEAPAIVISTAQAEGRERTVGLSLTGTLMPGQQSELTPLMAGRVTQVMVERGSRVRAGDPILRVRDADYRSALHAASASLEQARARLGEVNGRFDPEHTAEVRTAAAHRDSALDALQRAEQVHAAGAMSEQDYLRTRAQATAAEEQYRSAVNNARASYQGYRSASVSLSQRRRDVSDALLRAPFEGEIAERRANVGEFVSPQRAVVTLVSTDPLRIEVQVPQERFASVHAGQRIKIRVDAFPDRVFEGEVRYISASVRSDTRALPVEAMVPNSEGLLRPGLFATAEIELSRREPVLAIPTAGLITEAGTHRVYVVSEGRVQERVVSVVSREENTALISAGITAGERIATSELARLSDGARVQATP